MKILFSQQVLKMTGTRAHCSGTFDLEPSTLVIELSRYVLLYIIDNY